MSPGDVALCAFSGTIEPYALCKRDFSGNRLHAAAKFLHSGSKISHTRSLEIHRGGALVLNHVVKSRVRSLFLVNAEV